MSWYNPKEATLCWPEGEYDGVVKKVEPHVGKESGAVGRKVVLELYSGDKKMTLTDYLMSGPKSTWKIKEFAKAVNQIEQFNGGDFDPMNFAGASLRVNLLVEDDPQYGEQNKIGRYLAKEGSAPASKPAARAPVATAPAKVGHVPIGDADIPFAAFHGPHPWC